MIDAAKRASAQRNTAVMPFYGYAPQDRKDDGKHRRRANAEFTGPGPGGGPKQ